MFYFLRHQDCQHPLVLTLVLHATSQHPRTSTSVRIFSCATGHSIGALFRRALLVVSAITFQGFDVDGDGPAAVDAFGQQDLLSKLLLVAGVEGYVPSAQSSPTAQETIKTVEFLTFSRGSVTCFMTEYTES